MAIANHFYHSLIRKYVIVFGSIFNKLSITRDDLEGAEQQRMPVPISYGPYQKFLAMLSQSPKFDKKSAITLPRMAFEITSISYDGTRKIGSLKKLVRTETPSDSTNNFVYSPTPYNIEFSLYVMTKYAEDGAKIVEQILPFFQPDWTPSVKLIDHLDPFDIPIILSSVSTEDVYEGDFETRRSLMWTLNFTLKGYFFGPVRNKKVIKFIDTRFATKVDSNAIMEDQVTIQPGLTANGEYTTSIDETIDYEEINVGDDWGMIIITREFEDE